MKGIKFHKETQISIIHDKVHIHHLSRLQGYFYFSFSSNTSVSFIGPLSTLGLALNTYTTSYNATKSHKSHVM